MVVLVSNKRIARALTTPIMFIFMSFGFVAILSFTSTSSGD
ncbi:MAG: hypothetical protein QXL96_11135 [Ignisphaera sp.]